MDKPFQINKIRTEINKIHVWECPCCTKEIQGDTEQTVDEFLDYLFEIGVRFKKMKYMQGVFCEECYTDPEVQESSL